jgi:hypothetical protein
MATIFIPVVHEHVVSSYMYILDVANVILFLAVSNFIAVHFALTSVKIMAIISK